MLWHPRAAVGWKKARKTLRSPKPSTKSPRCYLVDVLLVVFERSRTEISIAAHLIAWKSIDAGCLYAISRCEGVSQFSSTFRDVASWVESSNTLILSWGPLTDFKYTVDSMPAVPGPPYWSVLARATHCPSGERDSVDQIVPTSLQPAMKLQSRTIVTQSPIWSFFPHSLELQSLLFMNRIDIHLAVH